VGGGLTDGVNLSEKLLGEFTVCLETPDHSSSRPARPVGLAGSAVAPAAVHPGRGPARQDVSGRPAIPSVHTGSTPAIGRICPLQQDDLVTAANDLVPRHAPAAETAFEWVLITDICSPRIRHEQASVRHSGSSRSGSASASASPTRFEVGEGLDDGPAVLRDPDAPPDRGRQTHHHSGQRLRWWVAQSDSR